MITDFPPSLVLNADFRPVQCLPLSTMSWQETIHNTVAGDVSVVAEYDIDVHSQNVTMRLPSVIALRAFVKPRLRPSLTRYNLLVLRDKSCCAYCGQRFPMDMLTYDHVVPRSHGGRTSWENMVSACERCNSTKLDRTPEKAGMPLLWRPRLPSMEELARADYYLRQRKIHETWKEFLPFLEAA